MLDNISRGAIREILASKDIRVRGVLRAALRRSLYVFTKIVTCWNEPVNLMDAPTFKDSCDWIQWVITTKKRGLFEDPRGHIKTTRTGRAGPTWCAIQVPDAELDLPEEYDRAMEFLESHPHMRGPDSRYVLGCDSKDRAAKFVGSSKTDWETNPVLRGLFNELVWPNYSRLPYGHWKDTGYSLPGRKNPSLTDDFLSAVGIDSKIQGGRAEGIFIDDLVGETSYKSPTELERRCEWVKTAGFLLENRDPQHPQGGFVLVDGNRWALDDVNSMIHNEFRDWAIWHRASFRCLVHLAGNCGRWADNEERDCAISDTPLWLGRYPDAESLARVERDVGHEAFAAQFLNDPTAAAELDVSLFRDFTLQARTVARPGRNPFRTWCVVIPPARDGESVAPGDPEIIPVAALSQHIISIDPADSKNPKNARTCITWTALDKPTYRVFVLDCRADQWQADAAVEAAYATFCDATEKLAGTRPRILCEKVACQGYVGAALKLICQRPGAPVRVTEPEMIKPTHGVSKDDRIRRRVGNRLNQGLLYIRGGLQLPRFEARHFPTSTKDSLDCLSQAEEVYLGEIGTKRSTDLAAARRRKRQRRIRFATVSGVGI